MQKLGGGGESTPEQRADTLVTSRLSLLRSTRISGAADSNTRAVFLNDPETHRTISCFIRAGADKASVVRLALPPFFRFLIYVKKKKNHLFVWHVSRDTFHKYKNHHNFTLRFEHNRTLRGTLAPGREKFGDETWKVGRPVQFPGTCFWGREFQKEHRGAFFSLHLLAFVLRNIPTQE